MLTGDRRDCIICGMPTNDTWSSPTNKQSECPRCHDHFVCDLAQGLDRCWCMTLPARLPVCADAKCLCPNCLAATIKKIESTEHDASML